MKKILFGFVFMLLAFSLIAGNLPIKLSITSQYGAEPVFNYISYDDLNWKNPEDQITLFTLNVVKNDPNFNNDTELRFEMSWNDVKSVEAFDNYDLPLILTNQDIIRADYPGGKITKIEGDLNEVFDALKPLVLDSGKIPDGDYTFRFVIVEKGHGFSDDYASHELSNEAILTFRVKSPMDITLVSPGNPITANPYTISNRNPYFVWVSNLDDYIIKIWEDNGSMNSEEQYENATSYYQSEVSYPNFEYPDSAPILKIGKVYAWQIIAPLKNSLTNDDNDYLKSKIYHFRIGSHQTENTTSTVIENYILRYKPEGWQAFMELLKEGYTLDQNDLEVIIKRISSGKKMTKIEID